jgi:predicted nucleic acid-binding protein
VRLYVDSSVILRIVLSAPNRLSEWHEVEPQSIASVLARVETLRALDRLRVNHELATSDLTHRYMAARDALRRITLVNMTRSVVRFASQPFPFSIKTLDAIHLSTAIGWRQTREPELGFATHDRQLAAAARKFGFAVVGV